MDFFQLFCSSSCSKYRSRANSAAACSRRRSDQAAPSDEASGQNDGSIFEHLNLRPSVVDDGELQFPPRAQIRNSPPRGSSAPRQRASGPQGNRRQQPDNPYTGADFLDLPASALHMPRPPVPSLQLSHTRVSGTSGSTQSAGQQRLAEASHAAHQDLAASQKARPLSTSSSGGPQESPVRFPFTTDGCLASSTTGVNYDMTGRRHSDGRHL